MSNFLHGIFQGMIKFVFLRRDKHTKILFGYNMSTEDPYMSEFPQMLRRTTTMCRNNNAGTIYHSVYPWWRHLWNGAMHVKTSILNVISLISKERKKTAGNSIEIKSSDSAD